jgi:septum formation protein
MTRVVLASASPARLRILLSAGVEPVVQVSGVDEDALIAELGSAAAPSDVVTTLARAKADDVAARMAAESSMAETSNDAVIIGCDSMLLRSGVLSGKPHTPEVARAQWQSMRGTTGELLTGHCVSRMRDGRIDASVAACAVTTIRFGSPTDAQIDAYVGTGEPLSVAGAFTLDGLGGWFIEGIDGDPSSVIGISLPLVRTLLGQLGLSVTELWSTR